MVEARGEELQERIGNRFHDHFTRIASPSHCCATRWLNAHVAGARGTLVSIPAGTAAAVAAVAALINFSSHVRDCCPWALHYSVVPCQTICSCSGSSTLTILVCSNACILDFLKRVDLASGSSGQSGWRHSVPLELFQSEAATFFCSRTCMLSQGDETIPSCRGWEFSELRRRANVP